MALLATTQVTRRFDNQLYDRLLAWNAPPIDDRILIVAIDDDSLLRIGAWPWRRQWHARAIARLRAAGARAIAYDVLFIEPTPDDALLATAMRRGPPVLLPLLLRAPGLDGAAVEAVPPTPMIASAAAAIGEVDLAPDGDGLIRHIALADGAANGAGRPLPHLMELAYRATTGHPSPNFAAGGAPPLLPYARGVGAFPTVSFAAVAAGEVPPAFLHGRTILIGATAAGMGDRFPTPLSRGTAVPGVELQANLLNALLAGRMIRTPGAGVLAALSCLPVVLLMLGFWRWPPGVALRCSIWAMLLVAAVAVAAMVVAGWWLPPGPALAGLLLVYPLWGWRRLQAISDYVDGELARFAAERDLALPQRPRRAPRDVIEAQTIRLAGAIDRIRDIRRFASDTVQSLPDALFVADLAGVVTLANAAACAVAGDDPVGANIHALLQRLAQPGSGEGELVLADGRCFVIARAALRHADGADSGEIIRLVDITAIRADERAREEVLQLLSHDMRSPQAAIITLVEAPDAGVPAEPAQRIARYARRTMALADNFVQLARMQAVPFVPLEMVLGDALAEAADELWTQARQNHVTIVTEGLEEPLFIAGEPAMLLRAFINLIDNAMRFSPPHSEVHCALTIAAGMAVARIADHGPGVAPDVIDSLFARFAAGADAGRRSSGLGLAFVKAVIDRHGGAIHCENSPHGACFVVTLPLLPEN